MAIADGIESDGLKNEINSLEGEKKLLAQKIDDLNATGDFHRIQVNYAIVEEYVMDLLSLFESNPIMVRRELPKFIKEINLVPIRTDRETYYRGYVKVLPNRILGEFSTKDLLPSTQVNAGSSIFGAVEEEMCFIMDLNNDFLSTKN